MVPELVQILPQAGNNTIALIALGAALLGAVFWMFGVRLSRPLVTLLTTLGGALIGKHLPGWFNWNISGAGPAVGGAVILGLSGFILHRLWMGIGLGIVLAVWTALAVWMLARNGQSFVWPAVSEDPHLKEYLQETWSTLPTNVTRILPYASGAALISGIAMCILWGKLTTVLNWSMSGVTMLVGCGLVACAYGKPDWLAKVPPQTSVQLAIVTLMVLLGAILQWKIAPKRMNKPDAPPEDEPAAEVKPQT